MAFKHAVFLVLLLLPFASATTISNTISSFVDINATSTIYTATLNATTIYENNSRVCTGTNGLCDVRYSGIGNSTCTDNSTHYALVQNLSLTPGTAPTSTCVYLSKTTTSGGGNLTASNLSSGYVPRATNSTNIATGSIQDDGAGLVTLSDLTTLMLGTTRLMSNATAAQTVIGTASSSGNAIVLANVTSMSQDYDHGSQTNPTFYVHSSTNPDTDNTQWLKLVHNVTSAILGVGNGSFSVQNSSGASNFNVTQNGTALIQTAGFIAGSPILTNASSISFTQLSGYSTALINTTLLNTTNSLSTGYCLTAAGSLDQMTWTSCGSGAGNITGGGNGTSGYLAMFTNATNIANSSIKMDTAGNTAFFRNLDILSVAGTGDRSISFNGTTCLYWVAATGRMRLGCGTTGTNLEIMGDAAYIANGINYDFSGYSDTVNRTISFSNSGAQELWFKVDDKVGINHTITATSKALTVGGYSNFTKPIYITPDSNNCAIFDSALGTCRLGWNSTTTWIVNTTGSKVQVGP